MIKQQNETKERMLRLYPCLLMQVDGCSLDVQKDKLRRYAEFQGFGSDFSRTANEKTGNKESLLRRGGI